MGILLALDVAPMTWVRSVPPFDLFRLHGRWLGLTAAVVGVVGEVLFFALIAFNTFGLVKLAAYGFCGFCALQVGGLPEARTPNST